jgi:Fragile site-associated protein C-terminus
MFFTHTQRTDVIFYAVCISEDPGKEPEHFVTHQLHIMEARLDYMGSSILMGRISDLALKLNDEWHVEAGRLEDRRGSVATSR